MKPHRRPRPTLHHPAAWRSAREAARSDDMLAEFGARWVFEARHGPDSWGDPLPVEPIPYQITRRASRARQDAAWDAALNALPAPAPLPPGRVRLFSNGSQWADWQGSNCERCTKGALNAERTGITPACPLPTSMTSATRAAR